MDLLQKKTKLPSFIHAPSINCMCVCASESIRRTGKPDLTIPMACVSSWERSIVYVVVFVFFISLFHFYSFEMCHVSSADRRPHFTLEQRNRPN